MKPSNEKPIDEQSEETKEQPTIAATVWAWGKALAVQHETISRGLSNLGVYPERNAKVPALQVFKALHGDKEEAMARKLNAEAVAQERKNKIEEEKYIDVEEAAKIYGDKMQAIIERLDAMPAMLDSRLAAETSPLIVRQILTEYNELTKVLARKSMEK